jgi:hypothetical protein
MFDIKIDSQDIKNVAWAKQCFTDLDINNKDRVLSLAIDSLTTRHKEFTFTKETSDDFPSHMNLILPLNSFSLIIVSNIRKVYELNRGDFIVFPSEIKYRALNTDNIDSMFELHKIYYYPKIKNTNGKNKYQIRSTLSDTYNIEIFADTEEDALQKAYNTPLPEWNHEGINNKPEKIKIVRWSEWGNFEIISKGSNS